MTPTHADPRRVPPALTLVPRSPAPANPVRLRVRDRLPERRHPCGAELLHADRLVILLADCGRLCLVRPKGGEAEWVAGGELVACEQAAPAGRA